MIDPDMPTLEKGSYRHVKSGRYYEVLGVAMQTETQDPLVVYRPMYSTKYELFARPYAMFAEQVEINGVLTPRFVKEDS